jgi:DNA-binding IclR family transcriptional regulator
MGAAARTGTQSLERAILLLKEVSTRGHFGWQLSDLAQRCSFGKSTAHRLLRCLVRERLVNQHPDGHYYPGPLLFELGLSRPAPMDFQLAMADRLSSLARAVNGIAFLNFRSGDDSVCAARYGTTSLKGVMTIPGTRRPLSVSAGGMAILVALPRSEANEIIKRNIQYLRKSGELRISAIRKMVAFSIMQGFGLHNGQIAPNIMSHGLPLFDANRKPFASISVAGHENDFTLSRFPQVQRALQREVEFAQRRLCNSLRYEA